MFSHFPPKNVFNRYIFVWDNNTKFCLHLCRQMEEHSGVNTRSQISGYELDGRMIGVQFSAGAGNFFLRDRVQTGAGAHPTSYLMGTGGLYPGGKAFGA